MDFLNIDDLGASAPEVLAELEGFADFDLDGPAVAAELKLETNDDTAVGLRDSRRDCVEQPSGKAGAHSPAAKVVAREETAPWNPQGSALRDSNRS